MIKPKIDFLPGQQPHFERLLKIESKNKFSIDNSSPGAGKTEMGLKRGEERGLEIIVVCPVNVVSVWQERSQKYNINCTIYKYGDLAGTIKSQPRCKFLTRNLENKLKLTDEEEPIYQVTVDLINLVNKGCLFIFDECQALKNVSAQSAAAATICRYINNTNTKTRYTFLSATFFDKQEFAVNIFKVMGIITEDKLIITDKLKGCQQAIDFCLKLDQLITEKVVDYYNLNMGYSRYPLEDINNCLYDLFIKVVMPNCSSSIQDSININGFNYFVYLSQTWVDFENKQIKALNKMIKEENNNKMNQTQKKIEQGMCEAVSELATMLLKEKKQRKIIIYTNFKISVTLLTSLLSDYNPLLLVGDTKQKDRPNIINSFNANNDKYRLLTCSMKVASQGIELDDKYGDFERVSLALPTYSILNLIQASGRTERKTSKSKSTFYCVWPANTSALLPIYDALAKKTTVLTDLGKTYKFPSEYENKISVAPPNCPKMDHSVLIKINKLSIHLF